MNSFDTYEVIKKRSWVFDTTSGLHDGHAEEVYVIKKNGYVGGEEFSSPEAANKYIDEFLTKDKEEMVDWRLYFDKNSYWKPSKDLTTPVYWDPTTITVTPIDWDPTTITCNYLRMSSDGTFIV